MLSFKCIHGLPQAVLEVASATLLGNQKHMAQTAELPIQNLAKQQVMVCPHRQKRLLEPKYQKRQDRT